MPRHFLGTILFFSLIILIVCAGWGARVSGFLPAIGVNSETISLGDWGDSFSAINTVFSGLAFLGIGSTIFLQIRSVRTQANEGGKAEFERVYFQIFSLVRELRKEISFSPPSVNTYAAKAKSATDLAFYGRTHASASRSANFRTTSGSAAMKSAYNSIKGIFENGPASIDVNFSNRIYSIVVSRRHEAEVSPYFRAVYSLLKRIDKCEYLSEMERLEYSRLLRSQMTSYEAIILGLNALTENSKDLRDYVIKYRMLKYSAQGVVRTFLESHYPPETFQGR